MPSTYSPDLRIELIANGEQSGTWGSTTNNNLGTLIEDAIAGAATVSVTTANQALTVLNGAVDQARNAAIVLTTTTAANFAVYVPPVTKLYVVSNTSAYIATIYCSTVAGNTTAAGVGVAVPAGKSMILRSTGVNIVEQMNHVAGNLSVAGDQAVTGNQIIGGAQTVTGISTFIASPLAPTPAVTDDTTKIATTEFVRNIIPSGIITMWSGSIATIPSGWLLCDGTNSTPDLRDRFIVGANADDAGVAKTNVTGSATQTGGSKDAIVVSHTHTESNPGDFITGNVAFDTGSQAGILGATTGVFSRSFLNNEFVSGGSTAAGLRGLNLQITAGSHTHTIDATGSSGTNANLPPYYALAYIMKS
jgi:hypothetical protein